MWVHNPFPALVKLADYPNASLPNIEGFDGFVKELNHEQRVAICQFGAAFSMIMMLPLYTQDVSSYNEFKNHQNKGQKILWYKEGVNANVAVRESEFGDTIQRTLVINGKADASTVADLHTQVLLGQILY